MISNETLVALVRPSVYLIGGLAIATYLYGVGTDLDALAVFVAAYVATFALFTLLRR